MTPGPLMWEITWQQPKIIHTVKGTYILVNSIADGTYNSNLKIRREYTPLLQIRLLFPHTHTHTQHYPKKSWEDRETRLDYLYFNNKKRKEQLLSKMVQKLTAQHSSYKCDITHSGDCWKCVDKTHQHQKQTPQQVNTVKPNVTFGMTHITLLSVTDSRRQHFHDKLRLPNPSAHPNAP